MAIIAAVTIPVIATAEDTIPVLPAQSDDTVMVPIYEPPVLTVPEKIAIAFPDAPVMVNIASAESKFVITAKNPKSTAAGLFQILIGTWYAYKCEGTRYNADDSIKCARKIYDAQGTSPWNSSKSKWGVEEA